MWREGRDLTQVELWKAGRRRKKLEGGLRKDQVKEGWWLMGFRPKKFGNFYPSGHEDSRVQGTWGQGSQMETSEA